MRLLSTFAPRIARPRLPFAPLRDLGLGLFLFVASLSLPSLVAGENVDEVWMQVLARLHADGARAGVDYVFCYGPLSDLILNPCEPRLFAREFAQELAVKAVMTLLIVRLASRLGPRGGPLLLVGLMLLMLELPLSLEMAMLAGVAALWVPLVGERIAARDIAVAAAYLAALSLTKFTALPFSLAGLVIFSLALARQSPRWRAFLPLPLYFLLLMAFFSLSGQRPGDLVAFLSAGFQYSAAYADGLALPGPLMELQAAAAILALMAAAVLTAGRTAIAHWPAIAIPALTASLYWKIGFVRHDAHALFFFTAMLALPALVLPPLAAAPRSRLRRALIAATLLLAAFGFGESIVRYEIALPAAADLPARWADRARDVVRPGEVRARLERYRLAMQAQHDLPLIRAAVGGEPIDAFTECQGVALLNNLNLVPRVTLQSVNAVHPDWLRANAERLRSEAAPRFLLLKWISFDGRFPTLNDGPALLAMLEHYDLRLEEKGFLLLERRPTPRGKTSRVILDRTASLDEVVDLPPLTPGEHRTLTLDVRPTTRGQLWSAAYRPAIVFLLVRDADGAWHPFRLIPPMARVEFLLDPLCESNPELRRLFESYAGRGLTGLKLHVIKVEASQVEREYSLRVTAHRLQP